MSNGPSPRLLLIILTALTALFVGVTGADMPARVASHFDGSGTADGFMPRDGYVTLMTGLVVLFPLLLGLVMPLAFRVPSLPINLPHRDHWLAPERREASVEFLVRHMAWFGCLLVGFMGYVHHLVVRANHAQPPALSTAGIYGGLFILVVGLTAWTAAMLRRFRLPPG